MLSDEEILATFNKGMHLDRKSRTSNRVRVSGLRAVEAAVRADQIEKDAAIADYWGTSEARTAIRAQLKGVSDE